VDDEQAKEYLATQSQGIPHDSQLGMWTMHIILYPGGEYARIPEGGL